MWLERLVGTMTVVEGMFGVAVQRGREGPPSDLVAFCAAQHPSVVGTLTLFVGDPQVAQELAQDVFVVVCRRWDEVRTLDRPGPWVHRVAMNLAASWFRRRSAERRATARLERRREIAPQSEEATALRDLVASLPPDERAVIALRYFADLDVADTAAVLGVPTGTVKTRTRRALGSLRAAGFQVEDEDG